MASTTHTTMTADRRLVTARDDARIRANIQGCMAKARRYFAEAADLGLSSEVSPLLDKIEIEFCASVDGAPVTNATALRCGGYLLEIGDILRAARNSAWPAE